MKRRIIETETLIVGAGPAGMACAMELSKKDKQFIVLDKQSVVGGLAKTYTFVEPDGSVFLTDNGPHRFFSKNPYLYQFIEEVLHDKWIKVKRQTRQLIDGKFYDYPINAMQALRNIGIFRASRMVFDYFLAVVQYRIFKKEIKSFRDYTIANFGKSLGEFNMINYTEKIWGIPADTIHPDWAKQRIKGLSLRTVAKDIILKLLKKKSDGPKSLVDEFYFPEMGTGQIYETIKDKLVSKGYEFYLGYTPIRIEQENNKIISVVVKKEIKKENRVEIEEVEFRFKNLVESIPITQFISLLSPKVPEKIAKSSGSLRHRNQVYLFITLNKESVTPDQWIYFPSKNSRIDRLSEMRNFSTKMSPVGKTSVFLEFFCFPTDEIWSMEKDQVFELAMKDIEKDGLFKREEVRNYYLLKQTFVYPVYDLEYENYLNKVKNYLNSFNNLYYIGRPGRFRYNNQDHSLEMGIAAAESIITKKKFDFETIGNDEEYHEKGEVYKSQKIKE